MEIKEYQTSITMRKLTPAQGKYLTQSADVADEERVFSTEVYLARDADQSSWRECEESEKTACEARVEAILKAQEK